MRRDEMRLEGQVDPNGTFQRKKNAKEQWIFSLSLSLSPTLSQGVKPRSGLSPFHLFPLSAGKFQRVPRNGRSPRHVRRCPRAVADPVLGRPLADENSARSASAHAKREG